MKSNSNKFGGERLDSVSPLSKNNLLEHLVRYELVTKTSPKKSIVLDLGCGTGYGSYAMAGHFNKIYGIDISKSAIEYARKYWKRNNITYLTSSATSIPYHNNSFDITVAFEVFEHIKHWKKFLKEVQRVTKSGGEVYLSTPNKNIYSPGTKKPVNPHHFFEMTVPEFKRALSKYFKIEEFWGQRTPIYNDHWVWNIVDPMLLRIKIPYGVNNTIKLKIINWIKPELERNDIVFSIFPEEIENSRILLARCRNIK